MLQELEDFLVPVQEEELPLLWQRLLEHLSRLLQAPASLLYAADPAEYAHFRYEAGVGLAHTPQPQVFKLGEGFLGQAVYEKAPLMQTFPAAVLGESWLSALVEVEEVSLVAIPLLYQGQVEGLWVLASTASEVPSLLKEPAWKAFLEKWAAYLHSLRSRRYIQALLEQTQVQNQELLTREEELRQNLEELAVTQEEMRRTQQLLAERARWQEFAIDLFTLMAGSAVPARFDSVARIFLAQLGQYVGAQACAALLPTEESFTLLYHWKARKAAFEPPAQWSFSEHLLSALTSQRTCTTATSREVGLEAGPSHWVVAPYFTPQGLGGLLAVGFAEATPLEPEAARAYSWLSIAFFSAYERIQSQIARYTSLIQTLAQLTGASIQRVNLSGFPAQLPWTPPGPDQSAYWDSLQKAIEDREDFWVPPPDLSAGRELVLLIGKETAVRLTWP
ncbi:MAG: hypothetical protein KatS3mg026_0752 [Bacteroidia bacterium]|nr:MAG: hypothetical protein KatS3mg026_0752 [Bacteroidia bacterium]